MRRRGISLSIRDSQRKDYSKNKKINVFSNKKSLRNNSNNLRLNVLNQEEQSNKDFGGYSSPKKSDMNLSRN